MTYSDLQTFLNDATAIHTSNPAEMAQTENANFSNPVRRMLGLGLDSWNNLMVAFLCIGALAAVVVGISTYVIIQLQKYEAKEAAQEFERYKLETGKKIAEAEAQAAEAQLALEKYKAARRLDDSSKRRIAHWPAVIIIAAMRQDARRLNRRGERCP